MFKLPSGIDRKILIDDLRVFSWEAADALLYYAQILKNSNNIRNDLKIDNYDDPVTSADLKVNEIIIKRITEKYKEVNWNILSEENVKSNPTFCDVNSDWLWILDPLDGTKDFIQGTKNYAMHLSLNYRNKPCIGIVLIPERDELWIADEEKVWCERKNKSIKEPYLLNKKSLGEMTIVTSKNNSNNTLRTLLDKIGFKEKIVMGSIGCKIASILRGDSDIYICLSLPGKSSPKDWDFSAPEIILKNAGGAITTLDNQELIYGKSNFVQGGIIIASNNNIYHGEFCSQIKEIIKKYELYPL